VSGPLRVGINLLWLVPGVVGGSEAYATGLLERLVERTDIAPTAYALPAFARRYPKLATGLRTVAAPLPEGRHVVRRVLAENSWLPKQTRDVDVMHHLGGLLPPRCRQPAAVTLHDLQYLEFPQYFSPTKRRYLRATQGRSLSRARVVMAISEFTRRQALSHFNLDADKVVVVPPFIRPASSASENVRDDVRSALGITREFVLYPAATYPHKNHAVLVRAFAQVAAEHDLDLVLTGATGAGAWGSAHSTEAEIRALAVSLGVADRVRLLGHLTTSELAALYAEAAMLAFPSRFEGFGLPVVEAMSMGCPVLAADATALPALVDDAGLLIDPDDVAAWAGAISRLIADGAERARLAAVGKARAAALAAVDPVDALVAAYRKAAA
jgi:glycosyltransferase involved in cell wall biosynthesis